MFQNFYKLRQPFKIKMVSLQAIIFYLFLLDSIVVNLMVWFSPSTVKWYKKKFPSFSKHAPLTKGWVSLYLILVLWIGFSLYKLAIIP